MSATLPKHHTLGTLEMDKRCSTCEKTTDTDADYCSTCGSMLEVLPTKPLSGSGLKRCGKCNKSLSTDRAFCRTCGTALEQVQKGRSGITNTTWFAVAAIGGILLILIIIGAAVSDDSSPQRQATPASTRTPTPAASTPTLAPTPAASTPTLAPTPAASTPTLAPTPAASTPTLAPIVACDDDCVQEHFLTAEVYCPPYIESVAEWDYDWTDGWLESKFDRAHRLDGGVVRYVGDKIKFQNGFGAWQHVSYTCDIDTSTEAVVGYNVTER